MVEIQLKLSDAMWQEESAERPLPVPIALPTFSQPALADWIEAHCLLLAQALAIGFRGVVQGEVYGWLAFS